MGKKDNVENLDNGETLEWLDHLEDMELRA